MEVVTAGLTNWQSFVLQALFLLVPVAIAYARQNGRIKALEKENADLRESFAKLNEKHSDLQSRYEATLKKQAGIRNGF